MSYVIAGATAGLLMGSVFTAIVPVILFNFAKDPSPGFRAFLERVPPMTLMMGIVVLAFPTWAIVGAALGLIYREVGGQASDGGVSGASLPYSLSVTAAGLALAAPWFLVIRKASAGVAALTATFILVFGWVLPLLAR